MLSGVFFFFSVSNDPLLSGIHLDCQTIKDVVISVSSGPCDRDYATTDRPLCALGLLGCSVTTARSYRESNTIAELISSVTVPVSNLGACDRDYYAIINRPPTTACVRVVPFQTARPCDRESTTKAKNDEYVIIPFQTARAMGIIMPSPIDHCVLFPSVCPTVVENCGRVGGEKTT